MKKKHVIYITAFEHCRTAGKFYARGLDDEDGI